MASSQGNSRSTSLLIVSAAGFASFLAMNSFSLWGFSSLSAHAFGTDISPWWTQPLVFSNVVAFFLFYALSKRWNRHLFQTTYPAAVLLLAGGMIALMGFLLTGSLWALACAGVLVGTGTTCCFFCWEYIFFASGATAGKQQIALGSTLSIPAFGLLFLFGPNNMMFSVSLLALCSLVLLQVARLLLQTAAAQKPGEEATAAAKTSPDRRTVRGSVLRAGLCIIVIGMISPILSGTSEALPNDSLENYASVLGANLLSALVMAFVWFVLRRKTSVVSTYVVLFPVLITGFFVLPFISPTYWPVVFFLGTFSFTLMSIVTMDWCAAVARDTPMTLFTVYGLLGGMLYASRLIGWLVASLVGMGATSLESQLFASVAILIYGCSLVMFVVIRKGFWRRNGAEASSGNSAPEGRDVLHEACLQLAAEHNLSERQTEVLSLLVHGYDVPSAAKKLFISENTVRTHMKKMYAVLDVHSKQEIIDLVNSRCSPASPLDVP